MGPQRASLRLLGGRPRLGRIALLALSVCLIALASWRGLARGAPQNATPKPSRVHVPLFLRWHEPARYTYRVLATYPHDREAFTQGLVYHQGALYESTGLRGKSELRLATLETGRVVRSRPIPAEYFGEGIALVGDTIVQLTWQSGVGFVYERDTFEPLERFGYDGEGWGLTYDGTHLIMSDGTAWLRFWDPETLAELGRIQVLDRGRPVTRLNELEWVDGLLYANIWQTDLIAMIAPETGIVTGWIDLAGLLPAADRYPSVDVLNGIAYDGISNRLYVTGKWWPKLYRIELVKLGGS